MSHPDEPTRGDAMVDDTDLRELFARRRPDPEAFAAGVAERLETAAKTRRRARASEPSFFDRAASVLPAIPSGSWLGKSWTTIVSLPALLVVGAFAAFRGSNKALDTSLAPDAERASRGKELAHASLRGLLPTLGSLLGLLTMFVGTAFGGSAVINVVTLVLLVSMAGLAWQVGHAARASGAPVANVTGFIAMLLLFALMGCVMWVQVQGVFDGDSTLGYSAVGYALVAGTVLVAAVATVLTRRLQWQATLSALLALTMLAVSWRPSVTVDDVRASLQRLDLQTGQLGGWEDAARSVRTLRAAGETLPDLTAVRDRVAAAIERDDADIHPIVWTSAGEMGLIDGSQWRRIAAWKMPAYRIERLLDRSGPLRQHDYDVYLLDALLATRELTEAERRHLVERADASWPDPTGPEKTDRLDAALVCVQWLDRLGRRDVIEANRARIHAVLRRHWVSEANAQRYVFPGGFQTYPDPLATASSVDATSTALTLIAHVGAPDDVPLHHVRAWLRHETRYAFAGLLRKAPLLRAGVIADRYLLEHVIGLPSRSWLEFLLGERQLLAALLLVLLGLRAVWLAHRFTPTHGPGALP